MTSTEFSIGLKEGARASSKVLKPPGGGSSNIFGFTENNDLKIEGTNGFQTPKKELLKDEAQNEANRYIPKSASKTVVRYDTITGEKIEMNMMIDNEDDKEVKRNPITGEVVSTMPKDIHVIQQDEPKKHSAITTSIRVRNPPGGKSSGIF